MASFKSILADVGNALKKVFGVGVEVAKIAEPIIDIAFPGIGALYNLTVTAAANAETNAIAAGAQSGTGPQKLAAVISAISTDFTAYCTAANIPFTTATITAWVNAVVASLNAIPASTTSTTETTATTAAMV
jgi:hypothetical protein